MSLANWIYAGALVHLIGGMLVLSSADLVNVTWTAAFHVLSGRMFEEYGNYVLGGIFLGAGGMAMLSFAVQKGKDVLIIPQFILFAASGLTVVYSALLGRYPDGYVPKGGGWFILLDQLPMLFFAVGHTVKFTQRMLRRGRA